MHLGWNGDKRSVVFETNDLRYHQDFRCNLRPIPSDLHFHLVGETNGLYQMVADGYGALPRYSIDGSYGNGALFVPRDQFTANGKRMIKRSKIKG